MLPVSDMIPHPRSDQQDLFVNCSPADTADPIQHSVPKGRRTKSLRQIFMISVGLRYFLGSFQVACFFISILYGP